MKRILLVLTVTMTLLSGVANAQPAEGRGRGQAPISAVPALNSDARQVRDELNTLFEQYPPTLRRVLQSDPTLLTNTAYLAPYPALAAYVAQHPEVPHNPAYFVGTANY